jgi:NAD(P)-dependent dehydrogenase (short-subunit alcohol dehydrogenase family)
MNVFITGGSSGLGHALAKAYAREGATVGLIARRADVLAEVLKELPEAKGKAHWSRAVDITDSEALASAAEAFMAHAGIPEVVIANAGISTGVQIGLPGDLAVIKRIFDTNVLATAATFAPFIAAMKTLPSSRLVAIASVAGIRGLPGSAAYSASKSAVITLAESLRIELAKTTIRVVTIAPGFIRTPMTRKNPYPMPFLMPVDAFAARAVRTIASGTSYRVIPWQMGVLAKVMRLVPNALFDRAMVNARRKPRTHE